MSFSTPPHKCKKQTKNAWLSRATTAILTVVVRLPTAKEMERTCASHGTRSKKTYVRIADNEHRTGIAVSVYAHAGRLVSDIVASEDHKVFLRATGKAYRDRKNEKIFAGIAPAAYSVSITAQNIKTWRGRSRNFERSTVLLCYLSARRPMLHTESIPITNKMGHSRLRGKPFRGARVETHPRLGTPCP